LAWHQNFVQKKRAFNVNEIDNRGQFHQHFMCAFCTNIFEPKDRLQSQKVTREKLRKALLYKKFERKMLMKLPPACLDFGKVQRKQMPTIKYILLIYVHQDLGL